MQAFFFLLNIVKKSLLTSFYINLIPYPPFFCHCNPGKSLTKEPWESEWPSDAGVVVKCDIEIECESVDVRASSGCDRCSGRYTVGTPHKKKKKGVPGPQFFFPLTGRCRQRQLLPAQAHLQQDRPRRRQRPEVNFIFLQTTFCY